MYSTLVPAAPYFVYKAMGQPGLAQKSTVTVWPLAGSDESPGVLDETLARGSLDALVAAHEGAELDGGGHDGRYPVFGDAVGP